MARGRSRGRGPVVHLDRLRKGQMIEAIISDHIEAPVSGFDLLDIGSGNGDISEYFAKSNRVWSVDIVDQRRAPGKAEFVLVDSERLPFPDASFDVVLSHHVIEHVADQTLHLSEVRRVLRLSGLAYMATPNRSSPIMEGHLGNERVLRWAQMTPMLTAAGFSVAEYGRRVVTDPDSFFAEVRFGRFLPAWMAGLLRRFYPSHMFVLTPDTSAQGDDDGC